MAVESHFMKPFFQFLILVFPLLIFLPGICPAQSSETPIEANQLILIRKTLNTGIENQRMMDLQKNHIENLFNLINQGKMIPLGNLNQGGGVFLTKSRYLNEVFNDLVNDEAISKHLFNLKIDSCVLIKNDLCALSDECNFSDYKLFTYYLNLNKETVKITASMEHKHQNYLQELFNQGKIVTYGLFKEGGFAILPSTQSTKMIYEDPAIINDYFYTEVIDFHGCALSLCH